MQFQSLSRVVLLFLFVVCSTSSGARAAMSYFWQSVPITATTDSSGVNIEGYQCLDLMITVTPGDDFQSARIFADPVGSIFHHPWGDNNQQHYGPPHPAVVSLFPALEFDSYLRGPNGEMSIWGRSDGINDYPPPGLFNEDLIAVAAAEYGDHFDGGTYQLMRFTYSGQTPQFVGRLFSRQVVEGIPLFIPEPAGAISMLILTCAILRRRA